MMAHADVKALAKLDALPDDACAYWKDGEDGSTEPCDKCTCCKSAMWPTIETEAKTVETKTERVEQSMIHLSDVRLAEQERDDAKTLAALWRQRALDAGYREQSQSKSIEPWDGLNGAQVVARGKDATVYVRLPSQLQWPIDGGCHCPFCKANPKLIPTWDTLAVPTSGTAWTVHMPDPEVFKASPYHYER